MIKSTAYFGYGFVLLILVVNLVILTGLTGEAEPETAKKPLVDRREYESLETATFAMGCFWGGDSLYGAVPGVVRTRVGYAGGTKENPTYHNLGKHTESIQVDFNPKVVSYEELVDIFWNNHNPHSKSYSTQYANILFYHNKYQKRVAERTLQNLTGDSQKEVYAQIKKITKFYPAESYHQKYQLRQSMPFIEIMEGLYPNDENLRDSTAAARLNGFLAGHGTPEQVESLVGKLGLTEETKEMLLKRFGVKVEDV